MEVDVMMRSHPAMVRTMEMMLAFLRPYFDIIDVMRKFPAIRANPTIDAEIEMFLKISLMNLVYFFIYKCKCTVDKTDL